MRSSRHVQADKSVMFYIRKKAGYEDVVCTFTVAAQGPVIVVAANTNTLDWNANSQTTANLALAAINAVTNAAADSYPIEGKYADSKSDDTTDDDLQVVDATAITMITGKWYPVYWDTSNCLHTGIGFEAGDRARLLSLAGGFTGTGSENSTLTVYSDATAMYSELLSAAALSATALSSTMLGEGIMSRLGEKLLVRIVRGTNLTVANWGVALGDPTDRVAM